MVGNVEAFCTYVQSIIFSCYRYSATQFRAWAPGKPVEKRRKKNMNKFAILILHSQWERRLPGHTHHHHTIAPLPLRYRHMAANGCGGVSLASALSTPQCMYIAGCPKYWFLSPHCLCNASRFLLPINKRTKWKEKQCAMNLMADRGGQRTAVEKQSTKRELLLVWQWVIRRWRVDSFDMQRDAPGRLDLIVDWQTVAGGCDFVATS